jgi:hypothetical protein
MGGGSPSHLPPTRMKREHDSTSQMALGMGKKEPRLIDVCANFVRNCCSPSVSCPRQPGSQALQNPLLVGGTDSHRVNRSTHHHYPSSSSSSSFGHAKFRIPNRVPDLQLSVRVTQRHALDGCLLDHISVGATHSRKLTCHSPWLDRCHPRCLSSGRGRQGP